MTTSARAMLCECAEKFAARLVAGLVALVVVIFFGVATRAQSNPTGTLTGTVLDTSNAVIPGAAVQVVEATTANAYHTTSGPDGHFLVGNLPPGMYTVTVTATGFQTGVYQSVSIVVGKIYDLKVTLKVGETSTTVTVEAGEQVLETTQTAIGTTIAGPVITHLPSDSNTALWGATMMSPAIQTIGGPRQSSAEGLPGGAVNVTLDGIAAQWQPGKSGDPLFTMVYTAIDDISEVNVSTAAASSNDSGEGAVQVNMVSQRGTNAWHGGAWEYFRNDWLNSNYYFNNLAGSPRQKMRYNQYGVKLGGPIWKDKVFFFADMDWLARPQSSSQTRTLLTTQAAQGQYTYAVASVPASLPAWVTCNAGALTCTADLMQMAANFGATSTVDSVVGSAIASAEQSTSAPSVHSLGPVSLFQQAITFNTPGSYGQKMPDFRLDWNITRNHSFEADYHLTKFSLGTDILNGRGVTYPVAPFSTNQGGYVADRQIFAWAWRWNLNPAQSNEVRFGFQASPEAFASNINPGVYPVMTTNLGSSRIQPGFPNSTTNGTPIQLMDDPWLTFTSPTQDNPGVAQLMDNFVWSKGNHSMAYGFTLTRSIYHDRNFSPSFAQLSLGMSSSDPMNANFNSSNLPGASVTDQGTAAQLYGLLAGRVTSYNGSVALDPSTRQFVTGRYLSDAYHQSDIGFYASDSWRFRPNLTFNYGLRWEYEGVPVDDLNEYFNLQGGSAALFGVSGKGNLFKPGTLAGSSPVYVLDNGKPWYNNWYKGFAPSLGVAWQPGFDNSIWHRVFGNAGDTVLRAGYSIAYSREGVFNWNASANPGYTGQQFDNAVSAPSGAGTFTAGSLQLQSLNIASVAQNPASFQTTIPINPAAFNSVNAEDPNLHMPYIQSWSFGVQRQLTPNMAFEVRYVGNHGVGLWQTVNLNEVNIFENNFLGEFNNAASNLQICMATPACASAPSFADQGLAGQVALPIFTSAFTGSQSGSQSDPNFSGPFVNLVSTGQAGSMANSLTGSSNLTFWQNLQAAGFPSNFFQVNPDATGGANLLRNGFQSTYNALVLDFRRRPSHGLQFDANYTFSKGLTDDWQRNTNNASDAFMTLRSRGLMKGPSPYDLRSVIKIYTVYNLPFGSGHFLDAHNSVINHIIGGWSFNAMNRWQTGRPALLFGGLGGTFNQNDGGVTLTGMSWNHLQSLAGVYKTPGTGPANPGAVWYFPQSILENTGSAPGVNPAVLAACSTPGQFCQRGFIYGPAFFRADWSLEKDTRITERVSSEFRVEFLNAFNNANFLWGDAYNAAGFYAGASFFSTVSGNLQNPAFGRIGTAYQDPDSTDDLGGRIIQLVARINF
jgi:carboxypeptidase family protein